jgi:hypothetical protein
VIFFRFFLYISKGIDYRVSIANMFLIIFPKFKDRNYILLLYLNVFYNRFL